MSTSKKKNFFLIGPVSSALMCSTAMAATGDKPGPQSKGAFCSEEDEDKQKSQQEASLSHVVEELFWIGNSIVAFSKLRLGYMGKLRQIVTAKMTSFENTHEKSDSILRYFVVSFYAAGQPSAIRLQAPALMMLVRFFSPLKKGSFGFMHFLRGAGRNGSVSGVTKHQIVPKGHHE